jgi:hypothetical protein
MAGTQIASHVNYTKQRSAAVITNSEFMTVLKAAAERKVNLKNFTSTFFL